MKKRVLFKNLIIITKRIMRKSCVIQDDGKKKTYTGNNYGRIRCKIMILMYYTADILS